MSPARAARRPPSPFARSMPTPDAPTAPHRDAAAWPLLIAGLGVESLLVLISTWMAPRLRRELSPEDLWQETLFMAWRDRAQHEWTDAPAYRRWLLGIARNRMRDSVTIMTAKKRGEGRVALNLSELPGADGGDSEVPPILPVSSTTPSRVAEGRERLEAMEEALTSLPDEYREAVRMRLFEQLTLPRIAEELGITLAMAKKRVYLGAERYRIRLSERLHLGKTGEWESQG